MWSRIRQFLSPDLRVREATEGASPPRQGPVDGDVDVTEDCSDLESRLGHLVSGHQGSGLLLSGRIQLVNLTNARRLLGGRWNAVSARVHKIAAQTLATRLSHQDLFTRYGEDSYVIVFGDCTAVEARLKCALIGEEIQNKLFGQQSEDMPAIEARSFVAEINGDITTERLSSVKEIVNLLDQAERHALCTGSDGEGSADRRARMAQPHIAHLRDVGLGRMVPVEAGSPAERHVETSIDEAAILAWQLRKQEAALAESSVAERELNKRAKQETMWAAGPAAPSDEATTVGIGSSAAYSWGGTVDSLDRSALANLKAEALVYYEPLWHAPTQKVGLYLAQARIRSEGLWSPDRQDVQGNVGSDVVEVIERIVLRTVRQELERENAGVVNAVGIPVNFRSLEQIRSRDSYLAICHTIPVIARRRVVWEIVQSPWEAWHNHLSDIVSSLCHLGRAVMLRTDLSMILQREVASRFSKLKSAGIHAVGLDLGSSRESEASLFPKLEQFAARATDAGLKAYVLGVRSMSVASEAACAGFDHIGGAAIAEPVARPEDIRSAEIGSLYMRDRGASTKAH